MLTTRFKDLAKRISLCIEENEIIDLLSQHFVESEVEDESNRQHCLDFLTHMVVFGRRQLYTPEQLQVILEISTSAWTECVSTSRDNYVSTLTNFEEHLLLFTVHRPPYSEQIFALHEAQDLLQYATKTFFAHFKLYKYVCTKLPRCALSVTYNGPNATSESDHKPIEELLINELEAGRPDDQVCRPRELLLTLIILRACPCSAQRVSP